MQDICKGCNGSLIKYRWTNYKSIKDSKWVEIKPLTIFIGPNNCGKTNLFTPLLLLKQTIESKDKRLPLRTKGKFVDIGDYSTIVNGYDIDKKLTFDLVFHYHEDIDYDESNNLPPGGIKLIYKIDSENNNIALDSMRILDISGKIILKRNLLKNQKYSFIYSKEIISRKIIRPIINDQPRNFLFNSKSLFNKIMENHRKESEDKDEMVTIRSINLPEDISTLWYDLEETRRSIENLLGNIDFIGPIRDHPKRYYERLGEKPYSVGPMGQYTSNILYYMKKNKDFSELNHWLSEFGLGGKIKIQEYEEGLFSVCIKRPKTTTTTNIADLGFGVSQILPLIAQGLWMSEERILVAEQPEIHLNPSLQSKLADFFVSLVNKKRNIILETHSEHLLLRLRSLVASEIITPEQIGLYFVEKVNNNTRIKQIPIDENGHIPDEEWPQGFFEDSFINLLILPQFKTKGVNKCH